MADRAAEPCVKGSVFVICVQGLKALLKHGAIRPGEVDARLDPTDFSYLEEKILPSGWYPVASFDRISGIAAHVLAGGDTAGFYLEQGRQAAARMLGEGPYQGFDSVAESRGDTAGPSMLKMAELIFNFSEWELHNEDGDPRHFEIQIRDAAAMPHSLELAARGFVQAVAERITGVSIQVEGSRPAPDQILYTGAPV